jgi:mannose-1-phosphate guanylyltransferase
MPSPIYALILAGGTGSRLWPRSRTRHPKQFLDLMGDTTMLQQAQSRLQPTITPENTFIATAKKYVDTVKKQLPELPIDNIIGEPMGRGTAAAIGLAALHIQKRSPDAVMAVLTADHLIKKVDVFRRVLEAANHVANEDWLVTLGIKPDYPETGYGYIERGEFLGSIGEFEGFQVARFVEKPNLEKAQKYLDSGSFDWNSGMFIWKASRVLDEMSSHMPELYSGLKEIADAIGDDDYETTLENTFPTLPNVTIDYGIMEKADKVAMIPVDIGWNDIGSWSALYDVLPKDVGNNAVVGQHISPDSQNTLVVSPNRLVATIGLDSFVIVDTEDVLLVCPRDRAQDVKKLVDILKQNGDAGYLDGVQTEQPLSESDVAVLFKNANTLEKVLLSMTLHAGLWPSHIVGLKSSDVDLMQGWVNTPDGRRPLPDATRQFLYSWLLEEDSLQFSFTDQWKNRDALKDALVDLGKRSGLKLTIDRIYETLARVLFGASEEGQAMQSVLGAEANLVRVPLSALFPFSLADFAGNETNALGERGRRVLNRAAEKLQ